MEERIRIAIRCVVLLRCLRESNYFDSITDCTPEQELHFLKLLFHFQFSIAYSVLQIYRVEGEVSGDIPLTALGSGIFDDLILFNHSCASNTTRFYQGTFRKNQVNYNIFLWYKVISLHLGFLILFRFFYQFFYQLM